MTPTGEHFFTHDHQFSVTAAIEVASNPANNSVAERYNYSAYGEVSFLVPATYAAKSVTSSDIGVEYLYTGRRLDPVTGLQLNRNRYYHAKLGRWINRDPLGYVDGMNLYGAYFVPGRVDPTGLQDGMLQPISESNVSVTVDQGYGEGGGNFDLGGRPRPIPGFTAIRVDANCSCETGALKCDIKIKVFIRVDPAGSREQLANPNGIYGHEERHVRNYLTALQAYADGLSDALNESDSDQGGPPACSCADRAAAAERGIHNFVEGLRSIESHHANPEPMDGLTEYPPLDGSGRRPRDPGEIPPWVTDELNDAVEDANEAADAQDNGSYNPSVGF